MDWQHFFSSPFEGKNGILYSMKIHPLTRSADGRLERKRLLDAAIRSTPGIDPEDRAALLAELNGDPRMKGEARLAIEARCDARARSARFYANAAESAEKWSGIVGVLGGVGALLAGHPISAIFTVIGLTGGIGWLAETASHKADAITAANTNLRLLEAQIHPLHF